MIVTITLFASIQNQYYCYFLRNKIKFYLLFLSYTDNGNISIFVLLGTFYYTNQKYYSYCYVFSQKTLALIKHSISEFVILMYPTSNTYI